MLKKEVKNKVGRPKLADKELKKKSCIMLGISVLLVMILLSGSLISLNILPKFGKMKGAVVCTIDQIPEDLRPGGLHEYGFDDAIFYSEVVSRISNNTSCTVTPEQLATITSLSAYNKGIKSANGIQYLTGLTNIYLKNNQLTSIDLSHNTALTKLELQNNQITNIDLSYQTKMDILDLSNNSLTGKLDLTNIDFSNMFPSIHGSIYGLNLSNNQLTSVKISNLSDGQGIFLQDNKLEEVILNNINTYSINISNNNLSSLNLSNNVVVVDSLKISNNQLSNIDLGNFTSLQSLDLSNNKLVGIDLGNFTSLQSFNLSNNQLNNIDLSNNTSLQSLDLSNNQLNNIDLSKNTSLKTINLSGNNLSSIDVSNGYNISSIDISNNKINKSYDVVIGDNVLFENNVITKYPNETKYNVANTSIAKYEDGKIIGIAYGTTTLSVTYKYNWYYGDINVIIDYPINVIYPQYEDAYKRAGFNDKNLYSCVVKSYNENISENSLLPDSIFLKINELDCKNKNILDTTGIEKLENLYYLYLSGNKIENINLSSMKKLRNLLLDNNPMTDTKYLIKGEKLNYDPIELNDEFPITTNISDESVISLSNNVLKALKEGSSVIELSNESIKGINLTYISINEYYNELYNSCAGNCDNEELINKVLTKYNVTMEDIYNMSYYLPYFFKQQIKVYDITSELYEIDKKIKTIDLNEMELDVSKITVSSDGLTGKVEDGKFVIYDGDKKVDEFTILNPKKVVEKKASTDKVESSNKKDEEETTPVKETSDIELKGTFVSSLALQSIKGTDRNIIVKSNNITITINGKDIENVEGNLDLKASIDNIENSIIKDELKNNIDNGIVLSFEGDSKLPGKVLVDVNVTNEMKEALDLNNINVYNYSDDKFNLIAESISAKNNKVSFYITKLGNYVITNDKAKENVYDDTKLIKVNKVLDKKSNSNKILVIILLIGIISGISYVLITKKNKSNKNKKRS